MFMKPILITILVLLILSFVYLITKPTPSYHQKTSINVPHTACINPVSEVYSVSAYNLGDPYQNWGDPCIGAWGDNLCTLLEQGTLICANNYYPKWTKLHIEGYGTCVVLDKMNSRYDKYYVDIAMPLDKKQEALNWGRRDILINVPSL